MSQSTAELRQLWENYECDENKMVIIPFGPDRIRVAPPTASAWEALAAVLQHHNYQIRTADTDSYNCRNIKGSEEKSLHSYGIALDINWNTNPFKDHEGERSPRFSDKDTQSGRADDVRVGKADTDMTQEMINDVLAIQTTSGKRVFEWGGNWKTVKDTMHFEIDVAPNDLDGGIDSNTVKGGGIESHFPSPSSSGVPYRITAFSGLRLRASPDDTSDNILGSFPKGTLVFVLSITDSWAAVSLDGDGDAEGFMSTEFLSPDTATVGSPPTNLGVPHRVTASSLRLRTEPSANSSIINTISNGTQVFVLSKEGLWSQVSLDADGHPDGFMSTQHLSPDIVAPAPASAPVFTPSSGSTGFLATVTADKVAKMFPHTKKANIENNLPFVLDGLQGCGLTDRVMVLMALATIRAETEGFLPISEGRSRFNTSVTPFDLYDKGTRTGTNLGNTQVGDGLRFKGRGYVQLTGRFNYDKIGTQIGVNLVANSDLANDPKVAGQILARFLKNKESQIREAIAKGDFKLARKKVNGGSHGFVQFKDAYDRGLIALV